MDRGRSAMTQATSSTGNDAPDHPPMARPRFSFRGDSLFYITFCVLGGSYILLIIAMVVADATYTTPNELIRPVVSDPEVRYSIGLSIMTCTMTTIISLWVAVPIGYLMSRHHFWGKAFVDTVLDIPIVLPPLVVGISLIILFKFSPQWLSDFVVFRVPAVILAQFMVAAAFAVRTMRITFEQISPRQEHVALTLGCTKNQAFWKVVLPEARGGLVAAATIAWARSLGEFGPVLIFAGSTPMKTEVLPTSVFLRFQAGQLTEALGVSMVMIIVAMVVLLSARLLGMERSIL